MGLVQSGLVAEREARTVPLLTKRAFTSRKLTGRKRRFPSWFPCLNIFAIVFSVASV